jgi:hypothetical protein
MSFLFRVFLYAIVFWLALRLVRALSGPRKRPQQPEPPPSPPSSGVRQDRIEDATFTDIPNKPKS